MTKGNPSLVASRPVADTEDDPPRVTQRPWRTPRLPELVGAIEASEILGVQKMTLHRWMRPGSGPLGPDKTYMLPAIRIKAGPVWVKSDVERFKAERGRQRARAGKARAS